MWPRVGSICMLARAVEWRRRSQPGPRHGRHIHFGGGCPRRTWCTIARGHRFGLGPDTCAAHAHFRPVNCPLKRFPLMRLLLCTAHRLVSAPVERTSGPLPALPLVLLHPHCKLHPWLTIQLYTGACSHACSGCRDNAALGLRKPHAEAPCAAAARSFLNYTTLPTADKRAQAAPPLWPPPRPRRRLCGVSLCVS